MRLSAGAFQVVAENFPRLIPDLPRGGIKDKSKGDAIAKSLVCFQGMRISQRETMTLVRTDATLHSCLVLRPMFCAPWPACRDQPPRAQHARARPLRLPDLLDLVGQATGCQKS